MPKLVRVKNTIPAATSPDGSVLGDLVTVTLIECANILSIGVVAGRDHNSQTGIKSLSLLVTLHSGVVPLAFVADINKKSAVSAFLAYADKVAIDYATGGDILDIEVKQF